MTVQGGQGCEGKAQGSGGGPPEEAPNPEVGGSQAKGAGRDLGYGHSMSGGGPATGDILPSQVSAVALAAQVAVVVA